MSKESKVDPGQLEEMTEYIKNAIKQLADKITQQTDNRNKVDTLGQEIYIKWQVINNAINQANQTLGTVQQRAEQREGNNDNPTLSETTGLTELNALENFTTTSGIIKELSSQIKDVDSETDELNNLDANLEKVCTTILEKIKKIEDILNDEDNKELRKKALKAGIITPGSLSTSAGAALKGTNVEDILGYEEGWDAETHFIFKDGAFLVQSGDDMNGFIGAGALAAIAKTAVGEKDYPSTCDEEASAALEEKNKSNPEYTTKDILDSTLKAMGSGASVTLAERGFEKIDIDTEYEKAKSNGYPYSKEKYIKERGEIVQSDAGEYYKYIDPDSGQGDSSEPKVLISKEDASLLSDKNGNYVYKAIEEGRYSSVDVNISEDNVKDAVKNYLENNEIAILSSTKENQNVSYNDVTSIELKNNYIVLHTTHVNSENKPLVYKLGVDYDNNKISLKSDRWFPIGEDD